jgi:hypothetical protein
VEASSTAGRGKTLEGMKPRRASGSGRVAAETKENPRCAGDGGTGFEEKP